MEHTQISDSGQAFDATVYRTEIDKIGSDSVAVAVAVTGKVSELERVHRGQVMLDSVLLRQLRQSKLMSQQDLANECWRRNIQISLTTIKRAEAGHAVRFRIARELARCFEVAIVQLLRASNHTAS